MPNPLPRPHMKHAIRPVSCPRAKHPFNQLHTKNGSRCVAAFPLCCGSSQGQDDQAVDKRVDTLCSPIRTSGCPTLACRRDVQNRIPGAKIWTSSESDRRSTCVEEKQASLIPRHSHTRQGVSLRVVSSARPVPPPKRPNNTAQRSGRCVSPSSTSQVNHSMILGLLLLIHTLYCLPILGEHA